MLQTGIKWFLKLLCYLTGTKWTLVPAQKQLVLIERGRIALFLVVLGTSIQLRHSSPPNSLLELHPHICSYLAISSLPHHWQLKSVGTRETTVRTHTYGPMAGTHLFH